MLAGVKECSGFFFQLVDASVHSLLRVSLQDVRPLNESAPTCIKHSFWRNFGQRHGANGLRGPDLLDWSGQCAMIWLYVDI
jgi:hypothetical protein